MDIFLSIYFGDIFVLNLFVQVIRQWRGEYKYQIHFVQNRLFGNFAAEES
jgi:hypothetical protein